MTNVQFVKASQDVKQIIALGDGKPELSEQEKSIFDIAKTYEMEGTTRLGVDIGGQVFFIDELKAFKREGDNNIITFKNGDVVTAPTKSNDGYTWVKPDGKTTSTVAGATIKTKAEIDAEKQRLEAENKKKADAAKKRQEEINNECRKLVEKSYNWEDGWRGFLNNKKYTDAEILTALSDDDVRDRLMYLASQNDLSPKTMFLISNKLNKIAAKNNITERVCIQTEGHNDIKIGVPGKNMEEVRSLNYGNAWGARGFNATFNGYGNEGYPTETILNFARTLNK